MRKRISALAAVCCLSLASSAALAQRLPIGVGLPSVPIGSTIQGANGIVNGATGPFNSTSGIVRDAVGRPKSRRAFEADEHGARIVRGEVLALSPSSQSIDTARGLKFQVLRQDTLEPLGISVAVLQVPDDMSATDALAALRKADPAGAYDYDHIYDPSAARGVRAAIDGGVEGTSVSAVRIGMIDGGLDRKHRVFSDAKIVSKSIAGTGDGVPTAHGTEVGSLLVGQSDDFHGALDGATLYAADVYGGDPAGGAADNIARALAWLAANNVPVVNISLAGPPNNILQAAVAASLKRGMVLVAAVGNDGPSSPVEYPAAYPGVIGVTSVDTEYKIQIDANRGPNVAFAALGVNVRAAAPRNQFAKVTGTSFAAPIVAARFALLVPQPDPASAQQARATLERAARRLDPATGFGFLDGRPGVATVSNR